MHFDGTERSLETLSKSEYFMFVDLNKIMFSCSGMAESIIAAAASRVGKKVLHLDRSALYYCIYQLTKVKLVINSY